MATKWAFWQRCLKIRTLGHSPNFLPQTYPQDLWINYRASPGACGDRHFAIYYAPFSHSRVPRRARQWKPTFTPTTPISRWPVVAETSSQRVPRSAKTFWSRFALPVIRFTRANRRSLTRAAASISSVANTVWTRGRPWLLVCNNYFDIILYIFSWNFADFKSIFQFFMSKM